jgi:exodeoxyribonuclease-5
MFLCLIANIKNISRSHYWQPFNLAIMLKDHINKILVESFAFNATSDQLATLLKMSEFLADDYQDQVFILKGYAGTGKTTLIAHLVNTFKQLKQKSVLLAPTGRAAKVLSSYSGKPAYTIHKKIYRQKSAKDGFGTFVIDKNLHTDTLFIVDESSMISNEQMNSSVFGSGNVLSDLVEYVYSGRGCKLILVGDTAQLPPVGLTDSPALTESVMETYGFQTFETELKEVVRQQQDTEVLFNATHLRELVRNKSKENPFLSCQFQKDLVRLNGADLLEELSDAYAGDSINDSLVICRSNKRANKYNEGIRNQVLFRESELATDDYLMIVKNNYFWVEDNDKIDFIANGDIAKIVSIDKIHSLYDFKFADVCLQFPDYDNLEMNTKILLDTLHSESPSLTMEDNKRLYYTILEDYAHLKGKKKQYEAVKSNEYFNALQVKFAYAVTCHKAQGGQWKRVFIDQGYITEEMISTDYYRWLYTAITRATEKVYLVNFPDKFFLE